MIVETILAIAVTVAGAFLWERAIRDRVSVKRLVEPDDEDLESLLDLYQRLFEDDGTNYSPAEVVEFVGESSEGRHVECDNVILLAKYHREVVGFLFAHVYPDRRKAIISYYGVDKEIPEVRRQASAKLLGRLHRLLLSGDLPCDYLFFDLQGVDPETPRSEARERRARPVLFKRKAEQLGFKAYRLEFPYRCPKVSLDPESREYPFSLMVIPIRTDLPRPVPRALVIEFLRFLHLDCYGDLYPTADERFEPYQAHLRARLADYEATLPETIGAG